MRDEGFPSDGGKGGGKPRLGGVGWQPTPKGCGQESKLGERAEEPQGWSKPGSLPIGPLASAKQDPLLLVDPNGAPDVRAEEAG